LKGKSAIYVARNFSGNKKNFSGEHFWSHGYFVSTIGKDEQMVNKYVRRQQQEDRRIDQLKFC
jgi:putative transposase